MLTLKDKNKRSIAVVTESGESSPCIEVMLQYPEALQEIFKIIKQHGSAFFSGEFDNFTLPDPMLNEGPLLLLFYPTQHGYHVNIRKPNLSDAAPQLKITRSGPKGEFTEIKAMNEIAQNLFVQMMGNGGRAIFRLDQRPDGLCMVSEARPAGRCKDEMYSVKFTAEDGLRDQVCITRDELVAFTSNPNIYDLEISHV